MGVIHRSKGPTTGFEWLMSFDPSSFDVTQLRYAGQAVLLLLFTASLAGYYLFAAAAHYFSEVRGILIYSA